MDRLKQKMMENSKQLEADTLNEKYKDTKTVKKAWKKDKKSQIIALIIVVFIILSIIL